MKCPRCGEANAVERLECSRCGEVLPDALDATGTRRLVARVADPLAPTVHDPRGSGSPTVQAPPTSPGSGTENTFSIHSPAASTPSVSGTERTLGGVFAGRYEILAVIGEGGMGRVYKARDRELDKVIALKTIRGESDADSVARFKQELVLARKITHKNVVRIYDLGEAEGVKFLTMEFIDGESLKALVKRRGRLPPEEAIAVGRQILAALQEAHEQGVVHRDLKPQNIMLDASGMLHLMDFGIARSMEGSGLTATGALIGTPDYMSPEQVKGERAVPASDLFSFGVILYEMLTGDLPYRADTPAARIFMRLNHKVRAPRELKKDIPRYLESVVLKSLETDPALRYATAGAILADLDRHQVDRALTVKVGRAVSKRRWPLLAGLAAALAGAAGLWLFTRTAAPPPAGPVHTLAVLPFTNAAGSSALEWLRAGLPDMLVTDLSQSQYVRPVPGERVARILQDSGLAGQARFDEAALEAVSKAARAQSVLSGQFVEAGGRLRLDLTLRRAGSGVPVPVKVEGSADDVFALVDQITARVKAHLDLHPAQLRGDVDRPIAEVSTASLEANRAYQAGLLELRRGAHQAAIPLLKEATAKDPGFAMAFARLAQAYAAADERTEASAASDRALALAEKATLPLAQRYAIHAAAAGVKEDHEAAVRSYEELAKLYPEDPDAQFLLAESLEAVGRIPDAVTAYEKAVALSPGYGAALVGLGRTRVMSGKPEEALRVLDEALETPTFKDNLEAQGLIHVIMGTACRELDRYDEAISHFERSLELRRKTGFKPGQASALSNLGDIYRHQGKLDQALDAQRKALAIAREIKDREGESAYLVSVGLIHGRMGQLDRSLAAFRESMQIEMERNDAVELANRQDHIAEIYRQKGQYEDALVYLEQARSHLEKSDEKREKALNFNLIGLVRKAQGLYTPAVEAFLLAQPLFREVGHEEGVANVQWDLASIYASQGRYADALNNLRQALEVHQKRESHDVGDVRADIAQALIAVGQLEAAEKELAEAEHAGGHGHGGHGDGPSPQVLFGRGQIARLRGRGDEAAKAYEQANVGANLSGQKEVAVRSRIELGRLYLDQGRAEMAERLLLRTRDEARQVRLRPLEAEAAEALAQAQLARGQAEAARRAALEALELAEKFEGRPTLLRAGAVLGDALLRLGRTPEALDAYAKAITTLQWIGGSVLPDHAASFRARPDVQAFARRAATALEKGSRSTDAAGLLSWLETGAGSPRPAS